MRRALVLIVLCWPALGGPASAALTQVFQSKSGLPVAAASFNPIDSAQHREIEAAAAGPVAACGEVPGADLGLVIQGPPAAELRAGAPFQLSIVVTNAGPDDSAATLFSSGDNNFVVVGYFLSQGQVAEFSEGGIPARVNFGSVPPLGTAQLALMLIPKKSGLLMFNSTVEGSVFEGEDDLPNTAAASLPVGPGQGIIEFTVSETNAWENSGQALVEVSRHDGASGTVQISYATQDRSALAGQDYVASGGTLTFLPGETSQVISVPLIDNAHRDCSRQLGLILSQPAGGAFLYGVTNLALILLDNDFVPSGELKAASVAAHSLNTSTGAGSAFPSISADGRWLAFMSTADDLVSNDTNQAADVFLKDLQTGQLQLVSVNTNGVRSGNGASAFPAVSADGRWVVFATMASDLVTNNVPPGTIQTVVRDLEKGVTQLASVTAGGSGSDGTSVPAYGLNNYNGNPAGGISSNGQVVLFYHAGRELVPGNTNAHIAFFARDFAAGTTRLVTVNAAGTGPSSGDQFPEAALSADGRRVVLRSLAHDLVAGFSSSAFIYQIYIRDLVSATTIPVSVRYADGKSSGNLSGQATLSADGRYVAFSADGNDLVPTDDNPNPDVFVRDVETGVTIRASAGLSRPCNTPTLSAGGRFLAFRSGVGNGPVPVNDSQVYVRDCWSNTLSLVSVNCPGNAPGNRHARNPAISSDGRYVFFQSFATDLAPGQFDGRIVSLYRRDLLLGETVLVSLNRALTGGPANPSGLLDSVNFSYPALSADGGVAAFAGNAEDLVWGDGNGSPDVFVWRAGYPWAAGPALAIDREGPDLVISWPRDATHFILQSTPDLQAPGWIDLPATGTNNCLKIPPSGRAFFRLKESASP